ncbi:hypothetical protein BN1708_020530, partial [Verticillium longisporum]
TSSSRSTMLLSETEVWVVWLLVSLTVWPHSTTPPGAMVCATATVSSSRRSSMGTRSRFPITGLTSTLGNSPAT